MAGLVGQTGFFPGDRWLRELDLLGDGLPLLHRLIPWERFRPILESVPKAKPKGPGGRKHFSILKYPGNNAAQLFNCILMNLVPRPCRFYIQQYDSSD